MADSAATSISRDGRARGSDGRRGSPVTTYRLQLHGGFDFAAARGLLPYLASLGVTDVYVSPIFTAVPGSTHGYDVCRHTEINPELGGEPAFQAFADDLRYLGMGLMLDFVPNHMSNDPRTNEWWRDVLENGPSSPFARFFDIDWTPEKPELRDRLLLPVLGEQYGEALERGALRLRFEDGVLALHYEELRIPLNPRRTPTVFEHDMERLESELGRDSGALREFLSILTALRNLPAYTERDPHHIAERQREKDVARDRLFALAAASSAVRGHIERALTAYNGTPGDPRSFDRLHQLLELQAYRLASWRTAADEINYRRFFDINALAGLRVETPEVFDAIHRLLLQLVEAGHATGVRLDHIDGLFDPQAYLVQLTAALRRAHGVDQGPHSAAEGADAAPDTEELYVAVEKILSSGERLREDWPVAGTTGYTFLNDVNGVFVDARQAKRLLRIYSRITGRDEPFADIAYESKRLIVSTALSSEFQVLATAVNRLSEHDRRSRDFTHASIRRAMREMVACFPVYRTYVTRNGATAADGAAVDVAIAEARRRNPAMESSIFDFLRTVLLPVPPADPTDPTAAAAYASRVDVAMRFQQYTAPVQAKGVEDTAFYRYHVLASLNEVGGDPARFGRSVADFHHANETRLRRWPREMLTTTTHDTKRSEDARARLNVLSEMPDDWQAAVSRWRRLNASNRTLIAGLPAPDANDEYLFYQVLVGAWPANALDGAQPTHAPTGFVDRLNTHMQKAIKEAKLHTSWITPHAAYEAAMSAFIERTLAGRKAPAFLASFLPVMRRIATAGMVNSLSQLVLKMASPGVADFYQGTEVWDVSMVDPDNRRPVDWSHRRILLRDLSPVLDRVALTSCGDTAAPTAGDEISRMLAAWPDGRIKAFVTAAGMRLRKARPGLILDGAYLPLATGGQYADALIACARHTASDVLLVVVPRLSSRRCSADVPLPLGQAAWADSCVHIPAAWANCTFRDLLTGIRVAPDRSSIRTENPTASLAARTLLDICPVALLLADAPPPG